MPRPAVFIDRDGTINEDVGYLSRPDDLVIYPWSAEAIRLLNEAGLKTIVITNQSGVARGHFTEEILKLIHIKLIEELSAARALVDAIYYCPHHPHIGDSGYRKLCDCRKPQTGLLQHAALDHDIDLRSSYVIGDKWSDIRLASNAGAHSILVLTGYGSATLARLAPGESKPDFVAANLLEAVKELLNDFLNEQN